MSYNKLPPELKHHITQEIQLSDKRYAIRMGLERQNQFPRIPDCDRTEPNEMDTFFRGRGIDNWSRVNKECRKLCGSILFGPIKDADAIEDIFQYQILYGPAASSITTLALLGQAEPEQLSQLLFHIAPHLPSLSEIAVGEDERIGTTAGAAQDFRWTQLLKIAKRIIRWQFELPRLEQMTPLLNANIQNLHSLTLCTNRKSKSIRLFQLVATCHSLVNLALHFPQQILSQYNSSRTLIGPDILLIDFASLTRLRSLTTSSRNGLLDSSVLEFASLFPNLERLDLEADDFVSTLPSAPEPPLGDTSQPRILLSPVSSLRLNFYDFSSMESVLARLSLPSLRHLIFVPRSSSGPSLDSLEPANHQLRVKSLASRIKDSRGPSLRLVTFDAHCNKMGPYTEGMGMAFRFACERYADLQGSRERASLRRRRESLLRESNNPKDTDAVSREEEKEGEEKTEVASAPEESGLDGAAETPLLLPYKTETLVPRRNKECYVFKRYDPSTELDAGMRRTDRGRIASKLRGLVQWAGQRVEALIEEEDLTGLRELEKGFKEIDDYKTWMED